MSYVHLVNCLLLTFGPLNAIYRSRRLHVVGGFMGLVVCVLFYMLTASLKTILMAFLLPPHSSFSAQLLQNTFNSLDALGLYFLLMTKSVSLDHKVNKIFLVAIGWSTAQSIFRHALFLFINASADAFSWASLIQSATANIEFFDNICLVALVLQLQKLTRLTRSQQNHSFMVSLLLFLVLIKTAGLPILLQCQPNLPAVHVLCSRAAFTLGLYLMTTNTGCFA